MRHKGRDGQRKINAKIRPQNIATNRAIHQPFRTICKGASLLKARKFWGKRGRDKGSPNWTWPYRDGGLSILSPNRGSLRLINSGMLYFTRRWCKSPSVIIEWSSHKGRSDPNSKMSPKKTQHPKWSTKHSSYHLTPWKLRREKRKKQNYLSVRR